MLKKNRIHLPGLQLKVNWVIKNEFENLEKLLIKNNFQVSGSKIAFASRVYLPDRYCLNKSFYHLFKNKVFFDYFHGDPRTSDVFLEIFKTVLLNKKKFNKIRVTHNEIMNLFLENKVEQDKLQKIYLPIDIENFFKVENEKKNLFKKVHKIPDSAFIIGSFQKDSNGWTNSKEPKLVKGPDIFIDTIKILKEKIKELFVILAGPQRGYIKEHLNKNNINFLHFEIDNKKDLNYLFNCLDVYLITSRQEGGPKTFLESLACQIPVVTTNVGQIKDLGINNVNSKISYTFEPEDLSQKVLSIYNNENNEKLKKFGLDTAKKNSYDELFNSWKDFFI